MSAIIHEHKREFKVTIANRICKRPSINRCCSAREFQVVYIANALIFFFSSIHIVLWPTSIIQSSIFIAKKSINRVSHHIGMSTRIRMHGCFGVFHIHKFILIIAKVERGIPLKVRCYHVCTTQRQFNTAVIH